MIGFAAWLFLTAVCIYLSGWIAGRRGRSTRLWYWMGAMLGPFAALAVALLPPVRDPAGRPPGGRTPGAARGGSGASRRTEGRASARDDVPLRARHCAGGDRVTAGKWQAEAVNRYG
jgi:hypothetical protein